MPRTRIEVETKIRVRKEQSPLLRLVYVLLAIPCGLYAYEFLLAENYAASGCLGGFAIGFLIEASKRYLPNK